MFTQSMEIVSAQYRCYLKLLTKSFLMFFFVCVCEKPIIFVEVLLENCELLSFKIIKMAKKVCLQKMC